jgi:transcriptional regulator with XRE-family HTH domain
MIEGALLNTVDRIMNLLASKGLKQSDLANRLGINQQTITDWKSGRSNSYYSFIVEIARFLGAKIDWLLTGEGDQAARLTDPNVPPLVLSETESIMLDEYRKANDAQRKAMLRAVLNASAANVGINSEKESIHEQPSEDAVNP